MLFSLLLSGCFPWGVGIGGGGGSASGPPSPQWYFKAPFSESLWSDNIWSNGSCRISVMILDSHLHFIFFLIAESGLSLIWIFNPTVCSGRLLRLPNLKHWCSWRSSVFKCKYQYHKGWVQLPVLFSRLRPSISASLTACAELFNKLASPTERLQMPTNQGQARTFAVQRKLL